LVRTTHRINEHSHVKCDHIFMRCVFIEAPKIIGDRIKLLLKLDLKVLRMSVKAGKLTVAGKSVPELTVAEEDKFSWYAIKSLL